MEQRSIMTGSEVLPTQEASAASGRLVLHLTPQGDHHDAAWNMAVDQAIAESTNSLVQTAQAAEPTLRFYCWPKPTLSLGYFQTAASADQYLLSRQNSAQGTGARPLGPPTLVRRSTGGGAILHHHELTYSLTVPCRTGEHGARNDLYRGVHQAVVDELADACIAARPYREDPSLETNEETFLCFQRRTDEDLITCGYKILGSAQRRTRTAILQHGSLLLRTSPHAPELPGIYDLTSQPLCTNSLATGISKRLGKLLKVTFIGGELSPTEKSQANRIASDRFRSESWWQRR